MVVAVVGEGGGGGTWGERKDEGGWGRERGTFGRTKAAGRPVAGERKSTARWERGEDEEKERGREEGQRERDTLVSPAPAFHPPPPRSLPSPNTPRGAAGQPASRLQEADTKEGRSKA